MQDLSKEAPWCYIFRVEGFGEAGYANVQAFIPNEGFKHPRDLAVDEMTEGKIHDGLKGWEHLRLWRTK